MKRLTLIKSLKHAPLLLILLNRAPNPQSPNPIAAQGESMSTLTTGFFRSWPCWVWQSTVAFILLVIGAILINTKETVNIAGSSFVYIPLPGGGAVTKQLVSLSVILGSFAAFFLVAGQRPGDRKKFMAVVLRPIRLALLTYSVYQYAKRASELTKSPSSLRNTSKPSSAG